MTLRELNDGLVAEILDVGGEGNLRQHLLDMGMIPGAEVKFLKRAPLGDPIEVQINGYSLSLRNSEAEKISVRLLSSSFQEGDTTSEEEPDFAYNLSLHEHNAHPGLGEGGIYHDKSHEQPLSKDTVLTFGLVGQQNCGKTTLFNQLTGSAQHVGNFPGVTVDRKDGTILGHPNTLVTDLPGIYSLSAYTEEELVSRDFCFYEKPKAIINIVDAGNIERNLYLTVQLMELDIPMVLALNMMDEVRNNGGNVWVNEMERLLGIPVVPVSASKGEGIDELVEHAIHIATYQEKPARQDFCDREDYGGAVHRCLHGIMHLIEDHAERAALPKRFAASRLVEGDSLIMDKLGLSDVEKKTVEEIILEMEEHRGLDRHAAMADMRFSFIKRLCSQTMVKPLQSKERIRTSKIDKILTGRWTAMPSFFIIISLVFWMTFDLLGARLQDLLQKGIDMLSSSTVSAMEAFGMNDIAVSLLRDAVFGGVGSVISFVPYIIVLFFFLSMLEDSGYMARIAFVSDKLLRHIGLSGRSIVPMLISFGCTVPGVMAARTLPSTKDRRTTILLNPFMSCSAKIAIYGFLSAAFFPGKAGFVMTSLYLLGILTGILVALFRKVISGGYEASPFVMELPVYRLPNAKNVAHLLWDKTRDFIQRAMSVILAATIVIWFLQSFTLTLDFAQSSSDSILAWLAGKIAPLLAPIGLGDWRIVTSLLSGFLAKESVVSTMELLGVLGSLTKASAVSLLIFCLLYTPCIAAIAAIRRELGTWWAIYIAIFQCMIAWIASYVGYQICEGQFNLYTLIGVALIALILHIPLRRKKNLRKSSCGGECRGCKGC